MDRPFADLIGLEFEAPERGHCSLTIELRRHHNPHGSANGAVLHSLADTGIGAALYPILDAGEICATAAIFRPRA
jgi:acyl-CoA thioesterase